jgi:NADH-quinone oxidoreductase subunit M
VPLLSLVLFLPLAGALLLALLPAERTGVIRRTALAITALDLALALVVWLSYLPRAVGLPFQMEEVYPWIAALGAGYHIGVDGLSLPFVLLTSLLGFLAVLVSWRIEHRAKLYFSLLLVLQTGVLGVFLSLDFLLFFLFWEVELIPMYLLIAIWGSPPPVGRREYSAMKFLIYTVFGSAFMLAGILLLWAGTGTFDLTRLAAMDLQKTAVPVTLVFWLIFAAFAVKLPVFPLHTWLPDAHTDAPTAVSVLLAGVLLKMGGYGILRICVGIFPDVAYVWGPTLALLAAVSVLYGGFVTLRQRDLKRLIAYSSVSHMGYVLLGVAALGETALTGAALQMVTHGLITGLLFAAVGLVYDKAHTRQIPDLQGLAHRMPFVALAFVVAGLASLGLPGMGGFVAEFMVFTGSFGVFGVYTVLAVLGIVLSAGYILWTAERCFFRTLPHRWERLEDAGAIERIPLLVLMAAIFLIGLWPSLVTDVLKAGIAPILGRLG